MNNINNNNMDDLGNININLQNIQNNYQQVPFYNNFKNFSS